GPERQANRDFLLSTGTPPYEHGGHVAAGHDEDQPNDHGRHRDHDRKILIADGKHAAARQQSDALAPAESVRIIMRHFETPGERVQRCLGSGYRDPGPQSPDHLESLDVAVMDHVAA